MLILSLTLSFVPQSGQSHLTKTTDQGACFLALFLLFIQSIEIHCLFCKLESHWSASFFIPIFLIIKVMLLLCHLLFIKYFWQLMYVEKLVDLLCESWGQCPSLTVHKIMMTYMVKFLIDD